MPRPAGAYSRLEGRHAWSADDAQDTVTDAFAIVKSSGQKGGSKTSSHYLQRPTRTRLLWSQPRVGRDYTCATPRVEPFAQSCIPRRATEPGGDVTRAPSNSGHGRAPVVVRSRPSIPSNNRGCVHHSAVSQNTHSVDGLTGAFRRDVIVLILLLVRFRHARSDPALARFVISRGHYFFSLLQSSLLVRQICIVITNKMKQRLMGGDNLLPLLVFLRAQTRVRVGHFDAELRRTFHDGFPFSRRDAVSDFGSEALVLHQEHFQFLRERFHISLLFRVKQGPPSHCEQGIS